MNEMFIAFCQIPSYTVSNVTKNKVAGMQSFIVLGIIPGTNIQTTLNFWIVVGILLGILACRTQLKLIYSRLQAYLVVRAMAHAIDHCEFNSFAS